MKEQGFSTTRKRGTEEMNRIAIEHGGFLQFLHILGSIRNFFPQKFCVPSHLILTVQATIFATT